MTDTAPDAPPAADAGSAEPDSRGGLVARLLSAFSAEDAAQGAPAAPHGLASLSRLRVYDVAIPRAEVSALPVEATLDECLALFRATAYSRIPVFEGTLDSPVGLLHFKDLALRHGFEDGADYDLRALLRPLIYVPPSMPIDVLLQKMQAERTHMALVIDEYGGVDGLVTLEDVTEQVIGDIDDEHDKLEGTLWQEEAPGCYLAYARAPLDEFSDAAGVPLAVEDAEEDPDTLGGLVFLLTGRIPARGEVVPHPSGAELEVVDADPRRIKRVRVRLPGAAAAPAPRAAAE